tara:strand:- start:8587 stop:10917 length:2331 start_codon:yes stop_codon:yes gene_type:complete
MANGNGNGNGSGNGKGPSPEEAAKVANAEALVNKEFAKQAKLLSELTQLQDKIKDAREKGIPVSEAALQKERELATATNELQVKLDAYRLKAEEAEKQQEALNNLFAAGKVALDGLVGSQNMAATSLTGFTSAVFKLVNDLDEATTGLGKATGFVDSFNKDITESAKATSDFSVSVAEAASAIGGLSTNMTLFNTLGAEQRKQLTTTTLALERLGVSSETTGQALDVLTRGMGMSVGAAANAAQSFDQLAQKVGLPVTEVIDGFNQISPQLARFGKQGTKVFGELTKQARSMGITIQEAFDIAEAFDTFETAAELAGKLNAQIGLQLNSVELMNASHEDRIKILQREFKMRGENFEDMSRRQKQAIAEVMGVDVDMASRIFGDPVQLRKYQREQKTLAERAKAVTTIQQDLNNLFQEMMLILGPVISGLRTVTKYIAGSTIPKFILLGVAITKLVGGMPLLIKGIGALASRSEFLTGLGDKMGNYFSKVGQGADKMAAGTKNAGSAAAASFPQLAGMALVITAIGAGIFLAATGVGNLVSSFKGLGDAAPYAVLGIVAFSAGLYFLIPALIKLGTVGWPGVAAILALGAAMVMMGKAVEFASGGITKIVTAVGTVVTTIMGSVAGVFGSINTLVSTFANMGLMALGKVALGITAIGSALKELFNIDYDNAPALTALLGSIGAAADGMEKLKGSVEALQSLEKVIQVSTELDATNAVALMALASVRGGPGEGAQGTSAVSPPPRAMKIPITFQLNNTEMQKYVIDIVNDEMDVMRVR